ncbi:MAG: hypothetical protein Unbinned8210contig1002_5 [Prokaryotic dsDNA virus sp.]|nr:MAG: hypothetical protein Unbinned8210contig1002_5 [Prokaryotic dsDNA virus sp.]|tara:strand:+ start:3046 stop:4242 length:1197 start_codon:yes stop_codon:yes gene_type:complete
MAIVRLTDIVETMKTKWTYGDKFFGYTEEFNDNHNTQYPSILISPPNSTYPEIMPRNGWEFYSFTIYFSDLYNNTQQQNESIQQRWDNLQDLANEWLDMFLKAYNGSEEGKTVLSNLTDDGVTVERVKEVANDKLLQIRMNFGYRIFSKCFTPVSTYPNQISNLTSWFRADSNVTFSIPTKKVSSVGNNMGNIISNSTTDSQPLRYSYGGLLDKTILTFDSDSLLSGQNFTTGGPTAEEFTIFEVSKINTASQSVFGYFELATGVSIEMGLSATGHYTGSISDGTTTLTASAGTSEPGTYHIGCLRKQNKSIFVDYKSATASSNLTDYDAAFDMSKSFEQEKFIIGCGRESDGLIPPAITNVRFMKGNLHEVVIYDRKLSDDEMAKVDDYLNKKYKIY